MMAFWGYIYKVIIFCYIFEDYFKVCHICVTFPNARVTLKFPVILQNGYFCISKSDHKVISKTSKNIIYSNGFL